MTPITLTYYTGDAAELTPTELALYGKLDPVRQATRSAIRRFVNENRELMSGRCLDYGCGKLGTCPVPQPYRSMLAATEYVGYEPGDAAPSGHFDSILCTQVLQNVEFPREIIGRFAAWMKPGAHLVLTYPVAWEEIEDERWRFTQKGIWYLAHEAGLQVLRQEPIVSVQLDGALNLVLVEGLVARK